MARNRTIDDFDGADVFDIRDVMARVEELEGEREALVDAADEATQEGGEVEAAAKAALDEFDGGEDGQELRDLQELLDETRGNGGDEQWRGDWYPVTFVRDSYFTQYAKETVEDIGDMPAEIPAYIVIDWDATAANIQQDYASVELRGTTYWYR